MSEAKSQDAHEHTFAEVVRSDSPPAEGLTVDDLRDVRLTVTADLGEASLLVREVLELKAGSVIPLDKLAGEMTDIYVNGIPLARGEVVVIADSLHVRIGEIIGAAPEEKEDEDL